MPKLATISMTSRNDKSENIRQAFSFMQRAVDAGAEWILLPEIFAFHGPYDQLYAMAEESNGPLNRALSDFAAKHKVVVIAGTVGERPSEDDPQLLAAKTSNKVKPVYNTTYVFGRDGAQIAKYRKIHLFNLLDANNKPLYCESDGFLSGSQTKTVEIDGFLCGLSICYDLRFPQFFQKLALAQSLDVLLVPSAFTKKTGEAHWELLLRARAVELQCYVYAANQTGEHSPGKESYGHSMIIDPWGVKLCDTGDDVGIAYADISKMRIAEVRGQLPALKNRRPELY